MAIEFDIIHASGRFDLVSRFLRADFTTWLGTTDASIVSGTEWDRLTTAQREAIMGGPDWDHHAQGGNGAAWRVDTWDLASTDYVKLSDLQYRTVTGKLFPKFHATVIVLRHKATGQLLTLLVVHMPTRGTARRRAVWDDVARGLVALIRVTKGPVVVAADFNAGWRKADLQRLLVDAFDEAGVEFGWAGRVPAGVRISMIDGHAVRGLVVRFSRLLPAAKAAEAFHRPVLIGLTLPGPTPPKETPVSKLVDKIIATAKKEVGTHEGRSGGHWNNHQKYSPAVPGLEWSQNQAWCATFVAWVAMKAGAAELYPRTASCDVGGSWFKKAGRWSEYPAIGAQVFFGKPSDLSHTGIVIGFDADTITTVEGNTNNTGSREGDGVYLMRHQRRSSRIIGYGYPKFPEGIVSADPKWQKTPPPKGEDVASETWIELLVRDVTALLDKYEPLILKHRTGPVARAWIAAGRAWLKEAPK